MFLTTGILALFSGWEIANGSLDETYFVRLLAIFIVCVALVPLICEAIAKRFDPFNPRNLFLFMFSMQFGFYPLYILAGGTRSQGMEIAALRIEAHYAYAQVLAILGLGSYLLGNSNRVADKWVHFLPRPKPLDRGRTRQLIWVLFALSYLATIIFFLRQGGLAEFLLNREAWRAGGLSGEGVFLFAMDLVLPTAGLLALILWTQRDEPVRATLRRFAFFCACLVPVFLLGFRGLIVIPLLQALSILHYRRRRFSVMFLGGLALFLTAFMTIYGLSRETPTAGGTFQDLRLQNSLALVFFRTPGTDLVATILSNDPEQHFEYGIKGAVEALTIMIPRGLWPGKPLTWGQQFSTTFFGNYLYLTGNRQDVYGGVNPSAIGYLYLQFGLASVVLGMLSLGAITKALYLYGTRTVGTNTGFLLYALSWPLLVAAVDAPENALNGAVITVCAWLCLSLFARRRTDRAGLV